MWVQRKGLGVGCEANSGLWSTGATVECVFTLRTPAVKGSRPKAWLCSGCPSACCPWAGSACFNTRPLLPFLGTSLEHSAS